MRKSTGTIKSPNPNTPKKTNKQQGEISLIKDKVFTRREMFVFLCKTLEIESGMTDFKVIFIKWDIIVNNFLNYDFICNNRNLYLFLIIEHGIDNFTCLFFDKAPKNRACYFNIKRDDN